jgi:NAD+ kinase
MFSRPEEQVPRRLSGRPSSLQIQHSSGEWTPDLVLDDSLSQSLSDGTMSVPDSVASSDVYAKVPVDMAPPKDIHVSTQIRPQKQPLNSPCFVHSMLNKGAFQDWLYQTGYSSGPVGVSPSLSGPMGEQIQLKQPPALPMPQPAPAQESPPSSVDDEGEGDDLEGTGSLTRQLAETAAGVREMSKQLGMSTVPERLILGIADICNRTCPGDSKYTKCDDYHQGQRQQAH